MNLDPMFKEIADTDNEQFNIYGSAKLNNTIRYLMKNIQLGESNTKGLWKPPTMPDTIRGNGFVPDNYEPEEHIQAMLDPLFEYDEDYMSKYIQGRDESDTYNVWVYEFKPKKYKKTIMLSAGTHGNEYTAFYSLMQFLQLLVTGWHTIPQLAYMRHNVRIVVMPIINPWGFKNSKRQNSRTVDLNRNSDYLWNEYTDSRGQFGQIYYKGTAPFSEIEARHVRDVAASLADDNFVAYLDFHTILTIDAEQILFTPRYLNQDLTAYSEVMQGITKPTDRLVWGTSAVPSFGNYVAKTHSVTSSNPEWCNRLRSPVTRDSIEMTACLEFFGNIITRVTLGAGKTELRTLHQPSLTVMTYKNTGASPITLTSSVYSNFAHTIKSFYIKRHALMEATGHVIVTLSAPATISIKPFLYQAYHPDWDFTSNKDTDLFATTLTLPAGTHKIDLKSTIHVFPTNHNSETTSRTELAKFRLRGKTSAGTLTLEKMEVFIKLTPTDKAFAMEVHDATGREAFSEDVDDYIRTYPNPAKFEDNEE